MTFHSMSIETFDIFYNFKDIRCYNVHDCDLDFQNITVKYNSWKPINNFLFNSNSNVRHTFYYFQDVLCENMHVLDYHLCEWFNVNC